MKVYNTPKEARNLREIEAAAISPVPETIKSVHGAVQPVQASQEEAPEETGAEAQAETFTKKERKKKNTSKV